MTEHRASCRRCGLPARARGSSDEAFCCTGCALAFHLAAQDVEDAPDRLLGRLLLAAFVSMGVMVFSLSLYGEHVWEGGGVELASEGAVAVRGIFRLATLALATIVLGLLLPPLVTALRASRQLLSADGLVLLAVAAAYGASLWSTFFDGEHVWFETASMVLVLFTAGRWLEVRAKERGAACLPELASLAGARAVRLLDDGREEEVAPDQLAIGELVLVRPGEAAPVDGEVVRGRAFVETSHLTGESRPRSVAPGDEVLAGSTAVDGALEVRATAVGQDRIAERVAALMREATASRTRSARIADRVAGALMPVVLLVAVGSVVSRWSTAGPEDALLSGLAVLLISCPCALGIATPLAWWVALGEAWRRGALVRSAEVLERVASLRRVWFDKTGTLTEGRPEVRGVDVVDGVDEAGAVRLAAALERGSEHPVGRALAAAADPSELVVDAFRALPGRGVEGRVDGALLRVVAAPGADDEPFTRVALERDAAVLAHFRLEDTPRAEASEVLAGLRERGLDVRGLSGDGPGPAGAIERALGLPIESELLPQDKWARVEAAGAGTAFVGDGLNDGAALAAASVGISVWNSAASSLEAADVNLLRPGLDLLPELVDLARAARRTALWSLTWAFAYNGVGVFLAATGRLSPVFAAAAMAASSATVVWNAGRLSGRLAPETATGAPDRRSPAPVSAVETART